MHHNRHHGHAPGAHPPGLEFDASLGAVWLGHATVLLHIADRWILTDPVFSHRVGPRVGKRTLGISRDRPMPVDPEHLPHIDVVVISHAHFDHLDRPTLERLAHERTTVITAERTGSLIPPGFASIIELCPGRAVHIGGLHIKAMPVAHWGSRVAVDRGRGCNAYTIESPDHRVVFAGDTAETDAFDDIDGANLAIFGIGAYEPWEHAHATPEQVWRMVNGIGAAYMMPIHHSTFELSDEAPDDPMRRLLEVAGDDGSRIIGRTVGELWTHE